MKGRRFIAAFVFLLPCLAAGGLATAGAARGAKAQDEAEVRAVVQRVFAQLRSGDYNSLYDVLPAAQQGRLTRERFVRALARSRDAYELDRIEVGAVRTSGDLAVAETTMYGRVRRPVEADGKIVAQQYLVRENGQWRVATGDAETVRRFLGANPAFAKRFPVRRPRVFVKQNNRWVEVTNLRPPRRTP